VSHRLLRVVRAVAFCLCVGLALGVFVSAAVLERFGLGLGALLIGAAVVYWVATILEDNW